MSTSVIRKQKISRILYAAAAVFCYVFQLIYEHYSHGVTSYYMVCAFLIPLAGLALNEVLFFHIKKICRVHDRQIRKCDYAVQLLSGAIIWLTLGSLYQGVLEIYGTTNHLIIVYALVGGAQAVGACVAALMATSTTYQTVS